MTILDRLVPTLGDVIADRYELVEELGRGGFGVVYLATQRGLEEDVAIKLLLPQLVVNPHVYGRFEREVHVAKRLRHPNTVRILDCGQTSEGLPFYVMEYIRGEPLDDVLKREGRLSAARTRDIAAQILKSLAEAHSQGVVHRDLKPGNIMLSEVFGERDYVKVVDFGIAKALAEPDGASHQTVTGMILGTPSYMSPEQAIGRREIDGRSDLYAVGLIVAECLVGRAIVQGETPLMSLAQHASNAPLLFPDELQQSPLWPIIHSATQKPRELRFRDATAMRDALEKVGTLPTTDLMLGKPQSDAPAPAETPVDSSPTSPMPFDLLLSSAKTMHAESPVEPAPSTPEPPKPAEEPRGVRFSIALVVLLFLAVGGGIAALVTLGPSHETPVEPDLSGTVASIDDDAAEPDAGTTLGEDAEEDAGSTAEQPEPDVVQSEGSQAVAMASLAVTLAVAADRLRQAVPRTRPVRFEGTEDVRVLLGEQLMGITPFEGLLPRVDRSLELHFEREGYRSSSETVSMLADLVAVELRRRRTPSTTSDPDLDSPETDSTPTPFGNAPIDER